MVLNYSKPFIILRYSSSYGTRSFCNLKAEPATATDSGERRGFLTCLGVATADVPHPDLMESMEVVTELRPAPLPN